MHNYQKILISNNEKIAIFCFFLSGFVSLIFEICWIRKSSFVFGSTIYATSSVIAVFFGGMAIGSFLTGRYIHKIKKPLFLYAIIELSTGIIALFSPLLFYLLDPLFSQIYPLIIANFILLSFVRLLFISIIILPTTILIGSTLPLFAHHFINKDNRISSFVPLLYAINTFGAVLGSIFCGFFSFRFLGINQSIFLGALINVIIGITIIRVKYSETKSIKKDQKTDIESQQLHKFQEKIVVGLFFFTGFNMLCSEILLTRYLALIIHNTIYTYVLTLAIMLTGIFLGSLVMYFIRDTIKYPLSIFIVSQLATGLIVQTVFLLPHSWWKQVIDTESIISQIWIISLIFLLPALFAGISYPCVIRIVTHHFTMAGMRTGFMNGVNTFGGICGSLIFAFIILPFLGLQKSLYLVTLLFLLVGIIALLTLDKNRNRLIKATIIGITIIIWIFIPFSLATNLPADFLEKNGTLIDFKEGVNSILGVIKSKENMKTLEINRLWQGHEKPTHQTMAAHIPMICHNNPQDILVIGLGIGQVAERFLYYPIKNLICVDIEKELSPLIQKHFSASWMNDPRASFVVDDGRNYVKHTDQLFDIISIEIGQVFRPGLSSFYTLDFYELVKKKLSRGGLACQFVPLSFFQLEEYKSLINTFIQVFPESILWFNNYEFIIIGYNEGKPLINESRYNDVVSLEKVKSDLDYFYWGGDQYKLNTIDNFIASILLGTDSLKSFTSQASVYTDNKPELEFTTAEYQQNNQERLRRIINEIKKYPENPLQFLIGEPEQKPRNHSLIAQIRSLNLDNILAFELYQQYLDNKSNDWLLKRAHALNSENIIILFAIADFYHKKKNLAEAIQYFSKLAQIDSTDVQVIRRLAYIYQENKDTENAIKWYNRLVKLNPEADVFNNLGALYFGMGEMEKSLEMFYEALKLNPKHKTARPNYDKIKKILKKSETKG